MTLGPSQRSTARPDDALLPSLHPGEFPWGQRGAAVRRGCSLCRRDRSHAVGNERSTPRSAAHHGREEVDRAEEKRGEPREAYIGTAIAARRHELVAFPSGGLSRSTVDRRARPPTPPVSTVDRRRVTSPPCVFDG